MGNNGCIGVSINDFDMLDHLKEIYSRTTGCENGLW